MDKIDVDSFNEFMRVLAEELRSQEVELRDESISVFREVINELSKQAEREFLSRFGLSSLTAMSPEQHQFFSWTVVVSLNRVLPLNHPYIVVFALASGGSLIGVMERRLIPGAHDLLRPDIFLVLKLREHHLPGGAIQKLNITDAEFRN